MPKLDDLFSSASYVLWDGGLGTTLADTYSIDTSSAVWSAQAVEESAEKLVSAHQEFLNSGARILDTATYQASFSTYELESKSRDEATFLMRRAVALAADARSRYESEHPAAPSTYISLSLGAFGATLVPVAHEFDGVYAPPFGPGEPRALFTDEEELQGLEALSVSALTDFHLERLRVFAEDPETWSAIDMIALETVPLTREVVAFRRAVTALFASGVTYKPVLISTVWQDGRFPGANGQQDAVKQVMDAFFGDEGTGARVPDAFGVNCTVLADLRAVVDSASVAIHGFHGIQRPWLALKPNGGQVFDPILKCWGFGSSDSKSKSTWSRDLVDYTRKLGKGRMWGGILVGGCCKTSFREIRELKDVLFLD